MYTFYRDILAALIQQKHDNTDYLKHFTFTKKESFSYL